VKVLQHRNTRLTGLVVGLSLDKVTVQDVAAVEDFVRMTANSKELAGPKDKGSPLCIIPGLSEMLPNMVDRQLKVITNLLLRDDPERRRRDIMPAKRSLDREPTIEREDGSEETSDRFRRPLAS